MENYMDHVLIYSKQEGGNSAYVCGHLCFCVRLLFANNSLQRGRLSEAVHAPRAAVLHLSDLTDC